MINRLSEKLINRILNSAKEYVVFNSAKGEIKVYCTSDKYYVSRLCNEGGVFFYREDLIPSLKARRKVLTTHISLHKTLFFFSESHREARPKAVTAKTLQAAKRAASLHREYYGNRISIFCSKTKRLLAYKERENDLWKDVTV